MFGLSRVPTKMLDRPRCSADEQGRQIVNILYIDCSPRMESHSRGLSSAIVERLLTIAPGATIIRRGLGAAPLPHATSEYATTLSSPATLAAPLEGSLDLSEELIREVEAADAILIGAPMHNLTVPSVLNTWIDQILRAGRTFKSTPNVRRYRLAAGISQEAVAVRMGVDRAFISGIERGLQNATLLTIWQTSQALGVKPADLLNETVAKVRS